jgi:hypothetical protein
VIPSEIILSSMVISSRNSWLVVSNPLLKEHNARAFRREAIAYC